MLARALFSKRQASLLTNSKAFRRFSTQLEKAK